jgi:DNA repair exonuclease SbcCD nuclease subunit
MLLNILHIADTHLRATQYGRLSRGRDFTAAFMDVIRTAIRMKVDAVLLTGDILDTTRPVSESVDTLKEVNKMAVEAKLRVLVSAGNHELAKPNWTSIVGSDGEFGLIAIENESFELNGVRFNALEYASNQTFLDREKEMPDADILLWHGQVREFLNFPSEKALTLDELPSRYHMILLGDIHVHESKRAHDGTTYVAYPGSTEVVRSSEDLEKWADHYTIDSTNVAAFKVNPIRIKTRQALRYKVRTEEEVQAMLEDLQLHADKDPLVFIKFDPLLENVFGRVCQIVDPNKAIIRDEPMDDISILRKAEDAEDDVTPADLLFHFVPESAPAYALGLLLLDPHTDGDLAIQTYMEEQTASA